MVIKVLDNCILLPELSIESTDKINVNITSFKKLFKGCKEVDISKLDNSVRNGYFTLRGHERVLCGSDIFVELPKDTHFRIVSYPEITLQRGLIVASTPTIINGEIGIIIVNTTPYLNRLEVGENIAQMILMNNVSIELESI